MGKQCLSQAVLESGSWGHSVLQTPALVVSKFYIPSIQLSFITVHLYVWQVPIVQNLTKLLANVMLKFLSWNMAKTIDIFCWKNVNGFA